MMTILRDQAGERDQLLAEAAAWQAAHPRECRCWPRGIRSPPRTIGPACRKRTPSEADLRRTPGFPSAGAPCGITTRPCKTLLAQGTASRRRSSPSSRPMRSGMGQGRRRGCFRKPGRTSSPSRRPARRWNCARRASRAAFWSSCRRCRSRLQPLLEADL